MNSHSQGESFLKALASGLCLLLLMVLVALFFEMDWAFHSEELVNLKPKTNWQRPADLVEEELLSGKIVVLGWERKVSDVVLSVVGTEISTSTDAQGTFTFRNLPAPPFLLEISDEMWGEKQWNIDTVDSPLRLELLPSSTIEVEVLID